MKLLLTIAWRNIQRHKGKSLVIGIILFLGALIMTVGNGVISGMDRGLRENIMNRFTGNVVLVSANQIDDNVIFIPMGKGLELIPEYYSVKKILDKQDYVSQYIPLCRGFITVLNEDGDMGFAFALGVNFPQYQKMFNNNVILMEGQLLKKDERGILIPSGQRKRMYDEQDFWVKPKGYPLKEESLTPEAKEHRKKLTVRDDVVIMGSSDDNFNVDIRADVKGIIKYEYLDDYWKYFNIIDLESYREAFNYVTGSDIEVKVPEEKKKILESENLDSIFGESVVTQADTKEKKYNVASMVARDKQKKKPALDPGTYNLVFIKLKNPGKIDASVRKLNAALRAGGAGARAISWKEASGQLGDMATIIRTALYIFVFLIFFVAIIIIMNTLSMAAMERASEIGMMRAVGSQKSFIRAMLFSETSILSGIFGGAGIVIGIIVVAVLNTMNITTTNNILQLLFGGNIFSPFIDISDIITGIIELILVTAIAAIYPMRVAAKITPLDAIARD